MELLRSLFGQVHDIAQNTIPDPRELMDNALKRTSVDDYAQQFIETPQHTAQQAAETFSKDLGL